MLWLLEFAAIPLGKTFYEAWLGIGDRRSKKSRGHGDQKVFQDNVHGHLLRFLDF
jgi:hypothetical protein